MTLRQRDGEEPAPAAEAEGVAALRQEVAALSRSLGGLGARVMALERRLGAARPDASPSEGVATEAPAAPTPEEISPPRQSAAATHVTFAGRTFLALAGGYLLRAASDGALLPPRLGVALGLLYAAVWVLAADRAAAGGQRASAGYHALAASLIGFPLIWETTRVFQLLEPLTAALALGGLMFLLLLAGWRHRLAEPAWLAVVGGAWVALTLLRLAPQPFAAVLLAHAVATLWLSWPRGWRALPWASAAAANLGVLLAVVSTPAGSTLLLQLALFTLYAGSFAWRAFPAGRQVGVLAFVQMPLVLVLGYLAPLAAASPALRTALGALGMAAGAGVYLLALRRLERARRSNLAFLGLLGLLTLLAGSHAALPAAHLAWAALAVVATWLGARARRLTLTLHGALVALAAAAGSGLLTVSALAWAAPAPVPWAYPEPGALLALAAALICLLTPRPDPRGYWGDWAHGPPLLLLGVVTFGGGGVLLQSAAVLTGGSAGPFGDAGQLAALRTFLLAAATVALAVAGSRPLLRQASWLVYPLLALGGLKLLLEDLFRGRPATLVLSLAIYGTALILAPRMARRARGARTSGDGRETRADPIE